MSSLDQIVRGSLCDHGDREIRFFAWLCRAGHGAVISATLFLPTQILDAFWQLYRRRRRSLTLLTRLLAPIDLAVSSHPMPPRPAPPRAARLWTLDGRAVCVHVAAVHVKRVVIMQYVTDMCHARSAAATTTATAATAAAHLPPQSPLRRPRAGRLQ